MTAIYHITHVGNLESVVKHGALLCDNERKRLALDCESIAHQHIKDRRAQRLVPLPPGGTLLDYVPFYFGPRSPMLYSIHGGYVANHVEGQRTVVHLVASAEGIADSGLDYVFTDGHAVISYSEFFSDLKHLQRIDWEVMKAVYWHDTPDDGDRKRRRQAEFLVYNAVPWKQIMAIGVIADDMAQRVKAALSSWNQPLRPRPST